MLDPFVFFFNWSCNLPISFDYSFMRISSSCFAAEPGVMISHYIEVLSAKAALYTS
jgi:hypothetical protein